MSEGDYDEEIRVVRVPRGSKRSKSRSTPNYERDLVRDEKGNLRGPTESRALTDEELMALQSRVLTDDEPMFFQSQSQTNYEPESSTDNKMLEAVARGVAEGIVEALMPHIERGVVNVAKKIKIKAKRVFSTLEEGEEFNPEYIEINQSSGINGIQLTLADDAPAPQVKMVDEIPDLKLTIIDSDDPILLTLADDTSTPQVEIIDSPDAQEEIVDSTPMTPKEYAVRLYYKLLAERFVAEQEDQLARAEIQGEIRVQIDMEMSRLAQENNLAIDEGTRRQIWEELQSFQRLGPVRGLESARARLDQVDPPA